MNIVALVLSILLIAACWATAAADFRRVPQVVEMLQRLGVPMRMVPVLGVAKAAGGLGLLIGQWNDGLLVFTAICLTAYFAAATLMHLRAKDSAQHTSLAAVLMVVSLVVVIAAI
ncbi:MAG: DoxX family protein [Actinomycetota bacterium]